MILLSQMELKIDFLYESMGMGEDFFLGDIND